MTIITETLLVAAGAAPAGAKLYAAPLAAACAARGISSPANVTWFLANVLNESAAMTRVTEDLYYSSAAYLHQVFPSHFATVADAAPYARNPAGVADKVYGGYQGRGLPQLTGRANYAAYAAAKGMPLVKMPDYLVSPEGAADSAAWFFVQRGCLGAADLLTVTRKWEGGAVPIGWASVQKWAGQVSRAMGVAVVAHPAAATPVVAHQTAKPSTQPARPAVPQPSSGQPGADALMDQFNSTTGA